MTRTIDLALIGGTGLYRFPDLQGVERHALDTPYGHPSDSIVIGTVGRHRIAFLARHGESHTIPPHRVNYRANLWALHHLGARRVIGINAVGGIRADMVPRILAVPDQIIDYTSERITSFCDVAGAQVRHIDFSEPYTASLRQGLIEAADSIGIAIVDGGCYGATQGPRLETRAEVSRMRRDGCDLVGMTGMPEAALARELDLEYACIALIANWAAGCGETKEISLAEIYANLAAATAQVPTLVVALLEGL
ncbi:MAG: S-methyl-5'-thioinosine phosphorylase [Flavobacteriales bacterium]|uniref:S-methyl-5'-thioinosine phosphorylase n=1 Tax=Dokdonella sp. TaxID=2291710 RepID=UPI001D92BEAF|nr:S-methyl-5'-thioinosine phosphorylase [Dokdonella sp.]MBZ0205292.1 S-methyl-5'-thioinosine phosphorylase [Flavobacteriales bacterium]MCC7255279.1 S-methyl-5'-thioinosine phosphorylase [Dokdonella sp.]